MLRQKTRRIVFWSALLAYPIAAILLLSYANGYRAHLNPFMIARTGNILATFEPTDAEIQLDGQSLGLVSPARVRAVFPGQHEITIKAPGYLEYKRRLTIDPLETTFVSDIWLVADAKSQPETNQIINLPTSPNSTSTQVLGRNISLLANATSGLVLKINNATSSRDLGFGNWQIAGGDDNFLALARSDKNEMQFRTWKDLDTVVVNVPGQTLINQEFKNANFFLVQSTFELWKMDSNNQTASLITRLSKPIKQVLPVPNTTIILVVLPDEIIAYQLKEDQPQPLTLIKNQNIIAAELDTAGKNLIYNLSSPTGAQTWIRPIVP